MQQLFLIGIFNYRLPDTVEISQQLSTLVNLDTMAAPLVEELLVFLHRPAAVIPQPETTATHG